MTNSKGSNVTRSISLKPELFKEAAERAQRLGFRKFSQYVQQLVREDLEKRPEFTIKERVLREQPPTLSSEISSEPSGVVRRRARRNPRSS
jgi:hypothetical protein